MWSRFRRKQQLFLLRHPHMRHTKCSDRRALFGCATAGQRLLEKQKQKGSPCSAADSIAATSVAKSLIESSRTGAAEMCQPRLQNGSETPSRKAHAAAVQLPAVQLLPSLHRKGRLASVILPVFNTARLPPHNKRLWPLSRTNTTEIPLQTTSDIETSACPRSVIQALREKRGAACTPASVSSFFCKYSIRQHPLFLGSTGVRNSSADVLKNHVFLFFFLLFLSLNLSSYPFHLPPLSIAVAAAPQAAVKVETDLSPLAAAALSAATRTQVAVVGIARSARAAPAAPAVTMLPGGTAKAAQSRLRTGDVHVQIAVPAAPVSTATAAEQPPVKKQQISSNLRNRYDASVLFRLDFRCLQHDPSFFTASAWSSSLSWPCHIAPLRHCLSTRRNVKQAQPLLTFQAPAAATGAAADSALSTEGAAKRCAARYLLRLLVLPLIPSRMPQQPRCSPGSKQPLYLIHSCTDSRRHCAMLSPINSNLPHPASSPTRAPRQTSPVVRTVWRRQHLIGSLETWKQHFTTPYSSLFSSLSFLPLNSSDSSTTSASLSVPSFRCCAPWRSNSAHEKSSGRRTAGRVCPCSTVASIGRVDKSSFAYIFPYIRRLYNSRLNSAGMDFLTTRSGHHPSAGRPARNFGALLCSQSAALLSLRSHESDYNQRASCVEEPTIPAQASSAERCQSEVHPPARTTGYSCSSPALSAAFAAPAFVRWPVLRWGQLQGKRPDVAAPQTCGSTQRLAGCAGAGAVGAALGSGTTKRAIRRVMTVQQRQQEAFSQSICERLKAPEGGGSFTQARILRQGVYYDRANSSCGRQHLCTLRNWLSYRTSNRVGGDTASDGSFTKTLCALPPNRRDEGFDSSRKRGQRSASIAEPASHNCVLLRPSWLQRAAASAIYLIPYMELFHTFLPSLVSLLPSMAPAWEGLAGVLELYTRIPCSNLLTFVAPYTFIIKKRSILNPSYFLRHHTMTALLLSMLQYTMSMIYFKGFRGSFADGSSRVHETVVLSLFLSVHTLLFNAVCHALAGECAWIPVVTEAVNMHIGDRPSEINNSAKDYTNVREGKSCQGTTPHSKL